MSKKLIMSKMSSYKKNTSYSIDQVFNALSLYIYSMQGHINDLYILSKILDKQSLEKLISYYDGDTLRIPSKEEFKQAELISSCYFLKEIQGWSWEKIKTFLQLTKADEDMFNTMSLGKQLIDIKENINRDISSMMKNLEEDDILSYIKLYVRSKK